VLSRGSNPNSKTSSSVPATLVPAGQRKFPDGYVGPADMPFCKVCYDAGLPVVDYTDHYVKDQPGPTGKVVCPTLLAQKCLTCGVAGHTSSYCSQKNQQDADRAAREREEREKAKKSNGGWETVGASTANSKPKPRIEDIKSKTGAVAVSAAAAAAAPPRKTYGGSFGALYVDDSSEDSEYEREQEEIRNTPANVPKPVAKEKSILTGPPPVVDPPKPLSWAQRAAAVAQKPVPSASSSSSSSGSALKDTRFQFHHLCDNIEMSKRAPPRKAQLNAHAPSPAAADAITIESSKKRKQDSAIVPA
jgi:hypothetical protein